MSELIFGTVTAVCRSEKKGTAKQNVGQGLLVREHGLSGDAHAGSGHRQVSLLSKEKADAFQAAGAEIADGAFGENLLVSGLDLATMPVGTRLRVGDALLIVTQIGKACHSDCEIRRQVGDCIMPREGIFARVERGGAVQVGDPVTVETAYRVAVLTASDRAFAGISVDVSGPLIGELAEAAGYAAVEYALLNDDSAPIIKQLTDWCDGGGIDLILTTGGTGFSPRDQMPEATLSAAERLAPGIAEALRAHSMAITPRAMLSRGIAAIRGRTLIVNLPGSPKAVRESLEFLLEPLKHGLDMLLGRGEG